jgi:transcriptional regulator with XRE-family HTH domain
VIKVIKQLVQCIKAKRIRQKITMAELSFKSGVSQKHISNIENEKVVPTLETLKKLARSLGFEINVSLEARDPPNSKNK